MPELDKRSSVAGIHDDIVSSSVSIAPKIGVRGT